MQKVVNLEAEEKLQIIVKGDFSQIINDQKINLIGNKDVSIKLDVNKTLMKVKFSPTVGRDGNFIFNASNGLVGAGIIYNP